MHNPTKTFQSVEYNITSSYSFKQVKNLHKEVTQCNAELGILIMIMNHDTQRGDTSFYYLSRSRCLAFHIIFFFTDEIALARVLTLNKY